MKTHDKQEQAEGGVRCSAWLASTGEPGKNFGRFNLPLTTRELVWQLSNGTPCEVPRVWLSAAMAAMARCFGNADIKVESDSKIAQLTPARAELNDYGLRMLANVELSDRRPL
jgi:hypothetical protein